VIKIFQGLQLAEAHHVRGLLEAEGIPARVRDEFLSTVMEAPLVIPGCLPTVWVLEPTHLARALEVVSRYRLGNRPEPVRPAWTCPCCGEHLEGQFTECWNCETARPD
jgi:hypothetical protein